ncbi:MAG: tRNA 2-thiouridine(34) synthase MnmA [Patescibacteria group bacterium]|nr:tRNA 2-thiouridine(34) synthase MnmA [Patescibacteria group bacterium]
MKQLRNKKSKILVAMSGGVDSSLVAALLVKQGYDVTGGFIKNWSDTKDLETGECQWRGERRDAIRVAASLDIPLLTFDFEKQYRKLVVKELFEGYEKGKTPNPDVLCNEYVKFGLFWEKAKKLGFDLMATGHYAKVATDRKGTARMFRGEDKGKDQSYFLYRVKQEALASTLFPLGGFTKTQVRRMAKKFKLPVAEKPDSQGICFIGKINFGEFLAKKLKPKPGDIVTPEGKVIGQHQGLHNYTIGQRHQIKVAGEHAWYVAGKDLNKNRLLVVRSPEDARLNANRLTMDDLHWIAGRPPKTPVKVLVQARYRQTPVPAKLKSVKNGRAELSLLTSIKAAATGQSGVIYKGRECLGGGVIT